MLNNKTTESTLAPEVHENLYKLERVINASMEFGEKQRLEEALTGRALTRAERVEIRRIVTTEQMLYNTVILRTQQAELYAVALPWRPEWRGPYTKYSIGFALCMPEDLTLPRAQRRIHGYRLAKKRAKRCDPAIQINVLLGKKVHPLLREKVIRLVLAAHTYPNPGATLGLGIYFGEHAESRVNNLFFGTNFSAELEEKYRPVLDAIAEKRKEEQDAELEETDKANAVDSASRPDLFSDGSEVARPVAESDD